ncbi:MAG: hypothetical protein KAW41_00115 [Candidatus Diapherotrites archaeon]|nr:hypothetical protein [Candidatus Diapherotrites archaeon]
MDCKKEVLKKLKGLQQGSIVFTTHAALQAKVRQVSLEEVEKNLLSPRRLRYAERQASRKGESKYNCYFGYSRTMVHRYVIVINAKAVVVTIIKIKKRWQRRIEKRGKK